MYRRLDVSKPKDNDLRNQFYIQLRNRFQALAEEDVDDSLQECSVQSEWDKIVRTSDYADYVATTTLEFK